MLQISCHFEEYNVSDLKLRPMIAGPACLTHQLSNFIGTLLRPFTNRVKSYLGDTVDFLNHLPDVVSYDTFLVLIDVESVFSNGTRGNQILAWTTSRRSSQTFHLRIYFRKY